MFKRFILIKLELMETFLVENGKKNLIFYCGETESALNKFRTKPKIQIVDSSNLILKGICVFFVRNSTAVAISSNNISQVIHLVFIAYLVL